MSNARVSFPAFLEVAGLQIELLLCEYVAVCEFVNDVGRINVFVHAGSNAYDKVLRYRKVDSRITHLQE